MFDVGFWEMVLTALVALVVFGPDKLPRLVREVSLWIRKARTAVAAAKSEIDQELHLYEMRQSFEERKKSFEREVKTLTISPPDPPVTPHSLPESVENSANETKHDRE